MCWCGGLEAGQPRGGTVTRVAASKQSCRRRGRGELTKRVLIYGINYAPEIAGVGRYTGEIGAYLASAGHQVTVVTAPPHYPGWKASPGYSARRWSAEVRDGARVLRCPLFLDANMRGIRRFLAPLSFAISSAPVLLYQALRRRPDVVLAVEPTLMVAPIALLAAKLARARSVLHVQDLEVDAAFAVGHLKGGGWVSRLAFGFERAVTRRFERVITISRRMAERLGMKGVSGDKICMVRNWVDTAAIRPLPRQDAYRRRLSIPEDAFVVLYSGNIGAKQGVQLLIDAARALQTEQRILFVIAGRGPMREHVERASLELSNVRLVDFQPEDRYGEFLNVADLHILPQERDAADLLLPSKLGGMLATGRPILVTAEPGTELTEFLGESCLFSPPGDPLALAQRVLSVSERPTTAGDREARLRLAGDLSKQPLISAFAEAALFLSPTSASAPPALAAA